MNVEIITFEEILPIWKNFLWKDMNKPIQAMSSMTYLGGVDMNIYIKFKPIFLGIKDNNIIIGVNSVHKTSNEEMRSRGLYVEPNFRGIGIGQKLLNFSKKIAKNEGCQKLWSYPRYESFSTYSKCGFIKESDYYISKDTNFKNCYASVKI